MSTHPFPPKGFGHTAKGRFVTAYRVQRPGMGDLIELWMGDPHDPDCGAEANCMGTFDVSYLDDVMSTLQAVAGRCSRLPTFHFPESHSG